MLSYTDQPALKSEREDMGWLQCVGASLNSLGKYLDRSAQLQHYCESAWWPRSTIYRSLAQDPKHSLFPRQLRARERHLFMKLLGPRNPWCHWPARVWLASEYPCKSEMAQEHKKSPWGDSKTWQDDIEIAMSRFTFPVSGNSAVF